MTCRRRSCSTTASPVRPRACSRLSKQAPHLAEAEIKRHPERSTHRTTLDRALQSALEDLARERLATLGAKLSAAIMTIDHRTGHVLAHVGSANFFDEQRQGAIDMTDVVRSPGSTPAGSIWP